MKRFLFCIMLFLVTTNGLATSSTTSSTTIDGPVTSSTTIGGPVTSSTLYDENIANTTLLYAYAAYCNNGSLLHWNCKWCNDLPYFEISAVANTDYLQAFVGYDKNQKQIVISFRGTHNINDWIYDAEISKTEYPGVPYGWVHKGFYRSWLKLQPQVFANLTQLINKYPNYPILITGHSLGGALAQLCALDVVLYNEKIENNSSVLVYTYGSPRWGNGEMANYYSKLVNTSWRIVNRYDIVPKHPSTILGYRHPGNEVWYYKDKPMMEYKICEIGEDPKCYYWQHSNKDHLSYMNVHEGC